MFTCQCLATLCRATATRCVALRPRYNQTTALQSGSIMSATNGFDPTIFKRYYTRKEDVSSLNLEENKTVSLLLKHVKYLNKGKSPGLPCKFKKIKEPGNSNSVFRVMQWNILAQGLSLGKDNFVRCPKDALDWDYRRLRVLEEILQIEPDVLCLQEVDHFGFLCQVLGVLGYKGTFFPKPDSPALYVKDTNGPDGCAIFYKMNVFDEIQQHSFQLEAEGEPTNQVCVTVTLKPKTGSSKPVTFAVTHLKAKRGWDTLRHKQGSYMLNYLSDMFNCSPLIVCGDFNAEKNEPVYEAFSQSNLGLESAYKALSDDGFQEPKYTTWKVRGGEGGAADVEVCRTIDYVWYSREALEVIGLKDFPSGEDMGRGRLPSYAYASDHLSLAVDFSLTY